MYVLKYFTILCTSVCTISGFVLVVMFIRTFLIQAEWDRRVTITRICLCNHYTIINSITKYLVLLTTITIAYEGNGRQNRVMVVNNAAP